MKESELRLGLLISGSGTTMEAVIKACQDRGGKLVGLVKPVVVISSKKDNEGITRAVTRGVETRIVQPHDFPTPDAFGERLLKILKNYGVDLVSQNGWLPLTPANVIREFESMFINQHPGPLDGKRKDFGGKGMYGSRVICARLTYEWVTEKKEPWTEATTHHVTQKCDEGELIRVVRMDIDSFNHPVTIAELRKNPDSLVETTKKVQKELLPVEHENVIATLAAFARGVYPSFSRSKPLIPPEQKETLFKAKKLAIELFPKG